MSRYRRYRTFIRTHHSAAVQLVGRGITAGVLVPIDTDLLLEGFAAVECPRNRSDLDRITDRRFAEGIYRAALVEGLVDKVAFADTPPPDD